MVGLRRWLFGRTSSFGTDGEVVGRFRVEPRGIENRHRDILRADQHRNFGAPQNDAIGPDLLEACDFIEINRSGFRTNNPAAQLVIDDAMDALPPTLLRNDDIVPTRSKSLLVEI